MSSPSPQQGPVHECPDYVSGGANSCHFDSSHTSIWKMYCMTVTAGVRPAATPPPRRTASTGADIVQTEAPVNLSYALRDTGGDERGHSALLAWSYPVPEDLQYGWITLVYELQYRRVTEPGDWKVKPPQRESQLELMGLPVGGYLVRVRCRSHNYGLWSEWSSPLQMTIPARPLAGKMLVLILVGGLGVATLLIICCGVVPQGKRIKAHFLPPIPKPRIGGIDPLLLKRGRLDEIDQHFRTFHSYSHTVLSEEVWNYVSTEASHTCALWPVEPPPISQWEKPAPPPSLGDPPTAPLDATITTTAMAPSSYCGLPPAQAPVSVAPYMQPVGAGQWEWPTVVAAPPPATADYSLLATQPVSPQPPDVVQFPQPIHPLPPLAPPTDFYTCAQLLGPGGEVNLVPCLTPTPQPRAPGREEAGEELKKRSPPDLRAETGVSAGLN
ncbi:growth hormone receptor-like [Gadus macrocephalus]|uniref:growth hormone receptor-like n=1 Tax=Gadus macrocephalus TaxID=80720 RepID=UPI0028CB608A|nr:growth hormone receptor-like [Gadus macrocephalus]